MASGGIKKAEGECCTAAKYIAWLLGVAWSCLELLGVSHLAFGWPPVRRRDTKL